MHVLVTGGAGFIGSYIVDLLVEKGHKVTVIDSLESQVHSGKYPSYLNSDAEYHWFSLSNIDLLRRILPSVDAVCHQAALVGVGQSMYEISRYSDFTIQQTAQLLELIAQHKNISKLVVASSMSIYGEGKYIKENGTVIRPQDRTLFMKPGSFDLFDQDELLKPAPIKENDSLTPYSIYGLTKLTQERMCMIIGKAYAIPTIALRYFGVYGNRQSLTNPYAGLMAMFAGSLMNGRPPLVFEDGEQIRDFIHVRDVALANILALEDSNLQSEVFNLTSGVPSTVKHVAETLCDIINPQIRPQYTLRYRKGDIRHCYGDVSSIGNKLGFNAKTQLADGLKEFSEWVAKQQNFNNLALMEQELITKNLLVDYQLNQP